MLFNSLEFLFLFLPLTIVGFFCIGRAGHRVANGWLLCASVFFYGYWNASFVPLLLSSIVVNYLVGERLRKSGSRGRAWLIGGVAFNLVLLGVFKYADFAVANGNALFGSAWPLPGIVLPLGISFFTFTQIAYLADVSQRRAREYEPMNYGLFVTFFPHLLAGPILHHREIMPQFASPAIRRPVPANIAAGLFLLIAGLAKKVLIADEVAPWANAGFADVPALNLIDAWIAALAYTIQIYFDFSGYSDMAIGMALLINVRLPINFDSPYKARNVRDFWRRWHITLSRFLRDYLYVLLGGNRRGWWLAGSFALLTFVLGGLWHGANWTFVVWGLLHGIGMLAVRTCDRFEIALPCWLACALTFLFVVVAWVFFRAASLGDAIYMVGTLFGAHGVDFRPGAGTWAPLFDAQNYAPAAIASLYPTLRSGTVLVLGLLIAWYGRNSQELLAGYRPTPGSVIACGTLCAALLVASVLEMQRASEFIYFNF